MAVSKSALIPMLSPAMPCRRAISRSNAKCGAGASSERRDAHQPGDGEAQAAAEGDEAVDACRQHAGLLRLLAGIDLDEERRLALLPLHFAGQRLGELRPVERLDDVEQRHRLLHLVGLQRADEMELEPGMAGFEGGKFRLRLLHAVLAEAALPGGDRRGDGGRVMGLAHRHQRHVPGIAAALGGGGGDAGADGGQVGGDHGAGRQLSLFSYQQGPATDN